MPRCEEGRPKFTVREWAEKRDGSWIFFTSTSETRDGSLPLQTAICDSLLRAIEKKRPGAPRVWVFCDELSLLKRMPSLIHAAALLRASGNPLVLGYQSSAQIEMEYGRPGMQALLGMPYTQICFASTDPVIQKHIEEQCGYAMREKLSENMPSHLHHGNKQARSSSLTSQQVAHEPVVMASEIGGLPPYEFVLKQQDMVIRGRIARNNRQRQMRYVRRLIPELVIEEPISAEDELEEDWRSRWMKIRSRLTRNLNLQRNAAGDHQRRLGLFCSTRRKTSLRWSKGHGKYKTFCDCQRGFGICKKVGWTDDAGGRYRALHLLSPASN